jgi:hypothetical protein
MAAMFLHSLHCNLVIIVCQYIIIVIFTPR